MQVDEGSLKHSQTFSDLFRPPQTSSDLFRPLQTFSDLFRPLQTSSDLFRPLQTFSDLLRLPQTSSDLFSSSRTASDLLRPSRTGSDHLKDCRKSVPAGHREATNGSTSIQHAEGRRWKSGEVGCCNAWSGLSTVLDSLFPPSRSRTSLCHLASCQQTPADDLLFAVWSSLV